MEKFKTVTLYQADCHELLKTFKDKEFDLAICDPPYGTMNAHLKTGEIGSGGQSRKGLRQDGNRFSHAASTKFTPKTWDSRPFDRSFFEQIFRVSKNWILWGAQHYCDNIPSPHNHSCEIIWDKDVYCDFAHTENAWTSFPTANRIFRYAWNGFRQGKLAGNAPMKEWRQRYPHPTQKPVVLYEWILSKYAKPAMRILDPTAGSGPCGIACLRAGLDCTLIENDAEYCGFIRDRLNNEVVKPALFEPEVIQNQIWR